MTWRRPVGDVPLTWRTTRRGALGRPKVKGRDGTIKDLSPIGAGVVVDSEDHDHVGEVVEVCVGGVWGPARIARIVAHPTEKLNYLGLEFVTVRHEFLLALNDLLDRAEQAIEHRKGGPAGSEAPEEFWSGDERRQSPGEPAAVRLPPFLDQTSVRRLASGG
ncbi:MAG: hypothetical protein HYX34_14600 [Actinobacteria bacterium]|nr:hypothetical protein [Actinomycetota bacterium]